MRWLSVLLCCGLVLSGTAVLAKEKKAPAPAAAASPAAALTSSGSQIDVSADESLEWHQDTHLYVARGNARAVRGDVTVEADLLTAHERDKDKQPAADSPEPKKDKASLSHESSLGGNLDLLTAEGHVHISDPRQQIFGEHAVYDLDQKTAKITGNNLKYLTSRDVITARDSMEYYEGENMALARGKAVAVHDDRRVEADVMKALFTQGPNGQMEMSAMSAEGNVTVVTKNDVSRGDKAVYDVKRNVAVLTGNVRITRGDTQLSGDRAEVDFTKNQSRLLNQGHGRVRALLTPKTAENASNSNTKTSPMDTGAKVRQKSGTTKTTAP